MFAPARPPCTRHPPHSGKHQHLCSSKYGLTSFRYCVKLHLITNIELFSPLQSNILPLFVIEPYILATCVRYNGRSHLQSSTRVRTGTRFLVLEDDTGGKQASSRAKTQFFPTSPARRKVFLQITAAVYRGSSNRSTLGEEIRVSGGSEQNLFCSFHLYNPHLMNLSPLEMSGCITLMVELDIVQAGRRCY